MTSSRLGLSSSRLNMQEEQHLIRKVKKTESLEEFLQNAKDDRMLIKISEQIAKGIIPSRAQEWTEKNFGTLSRLLIKEVQSIRLPGYLRNPNPLSYPDEIYIQTTKRIATVFVSRSSLNTFYQPLKIWIYNHWTEVIDISTEYPHFCVYSQKNESSQKESKIVELDIIDPVTKEKKKKLIAGETGLVEWNRSKNDGQSYAGNGWYQLIYLPETEDIAGATSSYSVDYFMDRENDFQFWQLRSSLQ
jgi:hypothetical protein